MLQICYFFVCAFWTVSSRILLYTGHVKMSLEMRYLLEK